jgi:hypothetical protein
MLINDRESSWKKKRKEKDFVKPQQKQVFYPATTKTCVGVNEFVFKRVFFFFFNEDGLGFSSHQYITKTRRCIINYQFLFVDDHSFFLRRFV